MSLITVIIPCYNEQDSLAQSVESVIALHTSWPQMEILIVDDGSTDQSAAIAKALAEQYPLVRVFAHPVNRGKGAALRTGFHHAAGDIVCIHDADLEYDPRDLLKMVQLIEENRADVVFGSRFTSGGAVRVLYFRHSLANKALTFISNIFTDLNMSDIECCYKVFRADLLRRIATRENRFGIEPELIAKCARLREGGHKIRICEVGVSYYGRTYNEGKKIGVLDGLRALWAIVKYNFPSS